MALNLDDKLLGEKVNNYCSSSEDEEETQDKGSDGEECGRKTIQGPKFIPDSELKDAPPMKEYAGFSTNTGPKGVINDWREFKRLETEKREQQEKERRSLLKKLSMTCRSHLDDEKEKQKDAEFAQQLDHTTEDFEEEFLKEYRRKRLEEMRNALQSVPKFGHVLELSSDSFLEAIDKEKAQVKVIIHLYEDRNKACKVMNDSFDSLATEYPTVKFCKLKASAAQLSDKFTKMGVPALLIYKGGELIGNFVRLSDELGSDFYSADVESFLLEHSFLPNDDVVNHIIKDSTTGEARARLAQDDDSDDSS